MNCFGRESTAARENTTIPIPHVLNTAVVTTNGEAMHTEELQRRTVAGYCAQASDQGNNETPITNYFCQTAVSNVRPFQLFATGAATVLEGTGEISQQGGNQDGDITD